MFRAIAGLWRWRHNPMCRRSDRVESWLALAAALAILVGAPLAGALGGDAAHRTLLKSVRQQQESRQHVWATVQQNLARPTVDPDPESTGERSSRYQVIAVWTAEDGSSHTGAIGAPGQTRVGDRFRIWIGTDGQPAPAPMKADTALSHAVLAGLVAAMTAGAAVEAGRRLALRQLLRRRYERWEREWARIGPDWGRADGRTDAPN